MSNTDKFVNEAFVDELLKSGVWDIARVDRGSRSDEELDEALVSERGGKKGDEGAGKDKEDDPDFSTKARKGDKSKTKKGKTDYKGDDDEDDDNGDDDNGDDKKKDFMKKFKESSSPRDLAEQLLDNLSEDVIAEFIDILYKSVLNEEAEEEVEEESEEDAEEDSE
jgi:hypothetical protein